MIASLLAVADLSDPSRIGIAQHTLGYAAESLQEVGRLAALTVGLFNHIEQVSQFAQ